jgi:ketosteroid isomerase-like protein
MTLADLIDRDAIRDLFHRYALAIDSRDWPAYRACFADHIALDFSAANGAAPGYQQQSADSWVATCQAFFEKLDATQHIPAVLKIDLAGDTASVVTQLHAQHHSAGTPGGDVQTMVGRYTGTVVRTAQGWRIAQLHLTVSWQEGNPTVVLRAFGLA